MKGYYFLYDYDLYGAISERDFTFTGRIKYSKKTTESKVSFEIEIKQKGYTRIGCYEGLLWWRKKLPDIRTFSYRKVWVTEHTIGFKELPEETIYECTTTSTSHGVSRS